MKGKISNYSLFPMNNAKAYFLGVFYGDGSFNDRKEINIDMNDFDILDSINKNVFDNKIIIRNRILKSGNSYDVIYNIKDIFINKINVNNINIILSRTKKGSNFWTIRWTNTKDSKAIGHWIYQNSDNLKGNKKFSIWNNF